MNCRACSHSRKCKYLTDFPTKQNMVQGHFIAESHAWIKTCMADPPRNAWCCQHFPFGLLQVLNNQFNFAKEVKPRGECILRPDDQTSTTHPALMPSGSAWKEEKVKICNWLSPPPSQNAAQSYFIVGSHAWINTHVRLIQKHAWLWDISCDK